MRTVCYIIHIAIRFFKIRKFVRCDKSNVVNGASTEGKLYQIDDSALVNKGTRVQKWHDVIKSHSIDLLPKH